MTIEQVGEMIDKISRIKRPKFIHNTDELPESFDMLKRLLMQAGAPSTVLHIRVEKNQAVGEGTLVLIETDMQEWIRGGFFVG